jgi:hypothetical protein
VTAIFVMAGILSIRRRVGRCGGAYSQGACDGGRRRASEPREDLGPDAQDLVLGDAPAAAHENRHAGGFEAHRDADGVVVRRSLTQYANQPPQR